jgi:hypothetical protein
MQPQSTVQTIMTHLVASARKFVVTQRSVDYSAARRADW